MKTINGYSVKDLPLILDQPLPPKAYKKIPGGANLTDVNANWQKRAFNKVFGLYGIGWGFDFNKEDMDLRHETVKRAAGDKEEAFAKVFGHFWFVVVENGEQKKISFPVTGANVSTMDNEAYVMKGAITNAMGFGASMLGWQESVYLGARSHDNPEGFSPGKGYVDVEPEFDSTESMAAPEPKKPEPKKPEPEPDPEPEAPKPTGEKNLAQKLGFENTTDAKPDKVGYCIDCGTIHVGSIPEICNGLNGTCESKKIIKTNSVEAAKKALAALAPAEPEPMKYPVCIKCGWAEPVNELHPACPRCGVVASDAFTVVGDHENMVKRQAEIKNKLAKEEGKEEAKEDLKVLAKKSEDVLNKIKQLTNNDRGLILRSLSEATGRTITGYSQASLEEKEKCLSNLLKEKSGNNNELTTPDCPKDRTELCKAIYALARDLGIGTPRQVIAEVSKVAGKSIDTLARLSEEELQKVYADFKGRKVA